MKQCQVHFVVVLCEYAGEVQRFPVSFGLHSERLPPSIPGPAAATDDLPADAAVPRGHAHMMYDDSMASTVQKSDCRRAIVRMLQTLSLNSANLIQQTALSGI